MQVISKEEFENIVKEVWFLIIRSPHHDLSGAWANNVANRLPPGYTVTVSHGWDEPAIQACYKSYTYSARIVTSRQLAGMNGTATRTEIVITMTQADKPALSNYENLREAIQNDHSYAWSWHCNLAVPIMDAIGIPHAEANKAAAYLMQYLWKVDTSKFDEYEIDKVLEPVVENTANSSYQDPEVNHIYVTVEGFNPQSGAVDTAKYIDAMLRAAGSCTELRLPTVTGDEKPFQIAEKHLITVTGIEQRDIIALAAEEDVDKEDEDVVLDEDLDPEDVVEADGSLELWGSEEGEDMVTETYSADPGPSTTLRITLDKLDTQPTTTIEYFRKLYPSADIDVTFAVCTELTKQIQAVAAYTGNDQDLLKKLDTLRSTVAAANTIANAHNVTVDPEDPNPEVTTENILANAGITAVDYKVSLDNPDDLAKAVMVRHWDEEEVVIAWIDTESPEFSIEDMYWSGVDVVDVSNYDKVYIWLKHWNPTALPYIDTLIGNVARWISKYGTREQVLAQHRVAADKPFTIHEIPQKAIPAVLEETVYKAWNDLLRVVNLTGIAVELDDPTVVVPFSDYHQVTRYGHLVVSEHPRQAELFLKLLKVRAATDENLEHWLRSMGK